MVGGKDGNEVYTSQVVEWLEAKIGMRQYITSVGVVAGKDGNEAGESQVVH